MVNSFYSVDNDYDYDLGRIMEYYYIAGVNLKDSVEDIKKKYRRFLLKNHPDKKSSNNVDSDSDDNLDNDYDNIDINEAKEAFNFALAIRQLDDTQISIDEKDYKYFSYDIDKMVSETKKISKDREQILQARYNMLAELLNKVKRYENGDLLESKFKNFTTVYEGDVDENFKKLIEERNNAFYCNNNHALNYEDALKYKKLRKEIEKFSYGNHKNKFLIKVKAKDYYNKNDVTDLDEVYGSKREPLIGEDTPINDEDTPISDEEYKMYIENRKKYDDFLSENFIDQAAKYKNIEIKERELERQSDNRPRRLLL